MAPKKFGTIRQTGEGRWSARYQYAGRKHSSPHPFVKESHAAAWLEKERGLIRDGDWTPPMERHQKKTKAKMTVSEWMDEYHEILEAGGKRKSTLRTYRNHTRSRIEAYPIGSVALGDLTPDIVQEWWDTLQRDFPPRNDGTASGRETSRKAYVRLRAACAEAVRRRMIPGNPCEVEKASHKSNGERKRKNLPAREELQAIVDNMADSYQVVGALCSFMGLRVGEALALEVTDVKVKEDPRVGPWLPLVAVEVNKNIQRVIEDGHTFMVKQPPKTEDGERTVPVLTDFAPAVIKIYSEAVAEGRTLLTATRTGKYVMDTSFRSIWNRARTKAGVNPEITPHYGRNWLITALSEAGATPAEIGQILGQKDLKTITETYMKVREQRPEDLMRRVASFTENEGGRR